MTEHFDREGHHGAEAPSAAQRVAQIGRETATYVQGGVERAADYAQTVTGAASETIADVTGREPREWAGQLRQFVGRSPLRAVGVAIVLGFAIGRLLRRA